MPVSWSRVYVRRTLPTESEVEARLFAVVEQFAATAEQEIKDQVWNYRRFVYRNVRPKPNYSKSERAWIGTAERRRGEYTIHMNNPITTARGVNYPKYVHLAGRARTDRLMVEVHDHMEYDVQPRLARAMGEALTELLAEAPMVTTRGGG